LSTIYSILQIELPTGGVVDINRFRYGTGTQRVAIVAGIRGDTPEGLRVAHEISESLIPLSDKLLGTVDIYPCVNPLAAEQGKRHWPFFDVDLNRRFPGNKNGHPPDRVAAALVEDIKGADIVIELRGARPGFEEIPHALVRKGDDFSSQIAMHGNVKIIWAKEAGPAAPKTFAYQFQHSIILEGGSGNRLNHEIGLMLHDGVLNILSRMGIFPEEELPFAWAAIERPICVDDTRVLRVRCNRGGLFIPDKKIGDWLEANDRIGRVIDPGLGIIREEIISKKSGFMSALKYHPVVSPGTMVARLLIEEE
jgi:uncharacterized protein